MTELKTYLDRGAEANTKNNADEAVQHFLKALDVAQTFNNGKGDDEAFEISYMGLGTAYFFQHHLLKSKESFLKAIEYNKAQFGENHKRAEYYQSKITVIDNMLMGSH